MHDEDPYRREPAPPAARGALRLGDEPLRFGTDRSERNRGAVGRGGWLIGVAIMMVWSLLFAMANAGGMAALLASTEVASAMDGAKAGALRFYLAVSAAMFALNLVALVLFAIKSPWFPRVYLAWLGIDLVLVSIATGLLSQASGDGFAGVAAAALVGRVLFWNGPWMAYAVMSERVRNTFAPRRA
ncbi:hypothetical protein GLE_5409 [Lysobacter enzymogenes]|uniref:DUF2569 domain-containing protein n=1 Tax=Lysobacter enzymogenes TaxID=69 RepID=A0A0S2DQA7_LYSEN|nr:DUF2569 family protein [Lysobacter enzymogenes]ALN60750.1 hypothetical protein GLE_5409 [Lysobacter enzymogenes]